MEFTKFDIKCHDLQNVADLIFETEPDLFSLFFGRNKNKALQNIKKIVQVGQNSFGHENIYLAIENNQILGLTIIYKGGKIDKKIESDTFSDSLDLLSLMRLLFFEKTLINRLLTKNLTEHEFYISNICVDKNYRGKGIGTFLLNKILHEAKKESCTTPILDVSKDNEIAINLYKKTGFEVCKERSSLLWKINVIKMMKKV